jgi:hypothetical protein
MEAELRQGARRAGHPLPSWTGQRRTWWVRTRSACSGTRPRAALLALDGVYGLGLDNFEHYDERIQSVTAEDVLRVARRIILLDRAVVAVVGP